jgi:hypothetical protein
MELKKAGHADALPFDPEMGLLLQGMSRFG